jgi:hypothetical protein
VYGGKRKPVERLEKKQIHMHPLSHNSDDQVFGHAGGFLLSTVCLVRFFFKEY